MRKQGIMLIWCDLMSDGVGNNNIIMVREKERQKKVERIYDIHCRFVGTCKLTGCITPRDLQSKIIPWNTLSFVFMKRSKSKPLSIPNPNPNLPLNIPYYIRFPILIYSLYGTRGLVTN